MDIDPAQPVPHPARRIVVRDDTPLDLDQLAATWDGEPATAGAFDSSGAC